MYLQFCKIRFLFSCQDLEDRFRREDKEKSSIKCHSEVHVHALFPLAHLSLNCYFDVSITELP